MSNGKTESRELAARARSASTLLARRAALQKNEFLRRLASGLQTSSRLILAANAQDVSEAAASGMSEAMLDRLTLTAERIDRIAVAVEEIIGLADPVGEIMDGQRRPNGLLVSRVRVPLGVVFFIYESRPNVTVDAAALCVKSGNAVILRGGSEAIRSNTALHAVIRTALEGSGLPGEAVQLVTSTDRAVVGELLQLREFIDVTIPRGGRSLIERVTREAAMPVLKHFDGVCHVFVDDSADEQMAVDIVVNSKCQRPGVCNAAETLLVHQAAVPRLLNRLATELQNRGVELRCCSASHARIAGSRLATEADFGTEHMALIMNVRIVESLEHAMDHIRRFGSAHTDAIVTQCESAALRFETEVDSAAVVINASTRFNDGGELGLGAEIGISTDRFHARGPCGLRELTTYKYVVRGTGQVRS